jgi:arylsulfatase
MTSQSPNDKRPNVVIIMADDMGFSDLFSSEIDTPHLDELGKSGIRFSQMYNCARCCPSRASLLTGLYPHQAGIGHMVHDNGSEDAAYQGYLRKDVATIAEILKDQGGYRTYMTGKWHVGGEYPPHVPEYWLEKAGDQQHPLPVQRGFDQHYGTLGGGGSYYDPPSLIQNETLILETPDDYYYTDAINDHACRMIKEATRDSEQPFFMYVAHVAPHWPLHAPPDIIAKYRGKYKDGGWDKLRQQRFESLQKEELIKKGWKLSPRDEHGAAWETVEHKDWEDARMATYAAQIHVMDQGIGRVLTCLKNESVFDNTLIIFLSDNGGCAEFLKEDGEEASWPEFYGGVASDGTRTVVGNDPTRMPGGRDSFMSYDLPWANASNTPFRLFKSWVHEGGIATPCLAHWPNGIENPGRIHHHSWIMMDIVATCYDVCGVEYPESYNGRAIPKLESVSFRSVFHDNQAERGVPMFWEHQGNRAVRHGKWKLVYAEHQSDNWELYDMEVDRTELCNLATQQPERVELMAHMWEEWARRCQVRPWPLDDIPKGEKDWAHYPWLW